MNNRPEMNEDFISSAGVPTIPLQSHKRRSFVDTTIYGVTLVLLIASMFVDYAPLVDTAARFVAPYSALVVLTGIIVAIVGVRSRRSLVLLAGMMAMVIGSELLIGLSTIGILLPLQLGIVLLVWYVYRRRMLLETVIWPVVGAALCALVGMTVLASTMGMIPGVVIMPVVIVATFVVLVWEIRRQLR